MSATTCGCDGEAVDLVRMGEVEKNLLTKKRKEGKCERRKHSHKTETADEQHAALRSREGCPACQGAARPCHALSVPSSWEPAAVSQAWCPEAQLAGGAVQKCEGLLPGNGALDPLCRKDPLHPGDS